MEQSQIYCPYSDCDIDAADSSVDHIIPVSLGGCDELVIRASRVMNSRLGHAVEAPLTKEPIVQIQRARTDSRGRSNKVVEAGYPASASGLPRLKAIIDRYGLSIVEPRTRARMPLEQTGITDLKITLSPLDQFVRIPFAAKVALGTGYWMFGPVFREETDHQHLRTLLAPFREIDEGTLKRNRANYLDILNDPGRLRPLKQHQSIEAALEYLGGSTIAVTCGRGNLFFSISLMGQWQATISVPANDSTFLDLVPALDSGVLIGSSGGRLSMFCLGDVVSKMRSDDSGREHFDRVSKRAERTASLGTS